MEYKLIARPGASHGKPLKSTVWWDFLQHKTVLVTIISVPCHHRRQARLNTIPALFCHSHWLGSEGSNRRSYLRNSIWNVTISYLDFADDICLLEDDFNAVHDLFSSVKSKPKKRAEESIPKKTQARFPKHAPENLKCGNDVLENVSHFNYLVSVITDNNNNINKEKKNRIAKATINSKRLSNFRKSNNSSTNLKAKLHQTCARSTHLYGSGSWELKKSGNKAIDVFENKCAHWFVNYMQRDSYIHAYGKLGTSIETVIGKRRL